MTSQIEGTQCTLDDILDPDADSNVIKVFHVGS